MSSTRLPGKVLATIVGRPMLAHVMGRLAHATTLDEVVLATTSGPEDDVLQAVAFREGWPVSRGDRDDVLGRYLQTARDHRADVIVRVTSDCPLIDPGLVDEVVDSLTTGFDYASNTLEPRTYPRGLDVEVVTRAALELAGRADREPGSREHVTPFIYRHPDRFRLRRVENPIDLSTHRWCVDVPEDLELVRRIYDALGQDRFGWHEALALCEAHPEWTALNQAVTQKAVG